MDEKDEIDESEISRNNNREYNSLVESYRAAYPAMPFKQVLQETKAIWKSLKDLFRMGLLYSLNVFLLITPPSEDIDEFPMVHNIENFLNMHKDAAQ